MNNNQIAAGAKNASETACSRIHGRCAPTRLFALIALTLTAPQKFVAALNSDSYRVLIGVRVAQENYTHADSAKYD
jgi:hypothetical protein